MRDNIKMEKVTTFMCDELIADAIIKLNDKGYDTLYCCSGHVDEILPAPYIMFGYEASIAFSITGITTPNNWKYDCEKYSNNIPLRLRMYRPITDEEYEIFGVEGIIKIAMKELNNWVDSLPDSKFKNAYTHTTIKKI